MKVDIRQYTRVIIIKNGKYLVGKDPVMNALKWSDSPYDAWWTRNADDARKVSAKIGGAMMLFNPIAYALKEMNAER